MTTLAAYVTRAMEIAGDEKVLGRSVLLTALAAQSATAASLAFGGVSEQRYAQWWIWRPTSTSVLDNPRNIDSFTPSSGAMAHTGAAYVDTTVGTETAFLCPPDLDVYLYRQGVNEIVQRVREWDETIVPARRLSMGEYSLSDLDWLDDSASIREIKWRSSNILSRNGDFEQWYSVTTGGVLQPSHWTLAGASATVTRGTTNLYDGPYVATLTRAGTNCTLLQTVGILPTGVSGDSLRTQTVTVFMRCRSATAAVLDCAIFENGTATANSSEHTGGSTYETLTASATILSTTDTLTFGARLVTSDVGVNIAQCKLVLGSTVSDSDYRNDNWDGVVHPSYYRFKQAGPLKLIAPNIGFPAQFLVCSERAFPAFNSARLISGDADSDESDAPLVPVATGLIWYLLKHRLGENHRDTKVWRAKFDAACAKHLAYPSDGSMGQPIMSGPIVRAAARVR